MTKPFLKWDGGKTSVLPELLSRMPEKYDTYVEPFLGGGALFFAVEPENAYLSDSNKALIRTYFEVRGDLWLVIELLRQHQDFHCKNHYLRARELFATQNDAALFIYLNKTCFNGLYRVNRKGVFNVPIGKQGLQGSPKIVDEDALKAAEAALEKVELSCNDFSAHTPIEGNFYYLDPPYLGVYDGYTQQGFDRSQHQRLAKFCKTIDKAKATFMLSHSDHPTIRKLYQNFHIEEIKARRSVSAKAESRGYVTELIIRNYK